MVTLQPVHSHGTSAHSCRNCAMRSCCLANELECTQLDRFQSIRGCVRLLKNGQHLFRHGEKFNAIYIVRSGMVKATIIDNDGEEQVTGFYLPGDLLGMDSLEDNHYRTTAEALETSSICILPFQKLIELGVEFPSLQKQLWRQTSKEIAKSQDLLLSVGRRDAEARLARFLLSMSLRFKHIGYSATEFRLPMGRHDIGNYLGMTLETVSRILARFEKSGYIKKKTREIRLIDFDALHFICNGDSCEKPATKFLHIETKTGVPSVSLKPGKRGSRCTATTG